MGNQNQRLNGLNPLAYIGVNAYEPTNYVNLNRDPNSNDLKNFELGTWWENTTNYNLWYLAAQTAGVATWLLVSGGTGSLVTLTGNSGGPVSPLIGNINVLGTGVITVVGTPGTNTLTVTPSGALASSFLTQAGTATPAAGVLTINGANGITTSGATSVVTITAGGALAQSFVTNPVTATATPAVGVLTFAGAGGTVVSAAGSTVTITGSGGTVQSVTAGTGISVTGTATNPIINNTGVLSVTGGSGVTITGTASAPIVNISGAAIASFSAYNSADDLNTTGSGTQYTVICDTEVYDTGANYDNATGIFQAPVAGTYHFDCAVGIQSQSAAMTAGLVSFIIGGTGPSVGTWGVFRNNSTATQSVVDGIWRCGGSLSTYLAAGDTAKVIVRILSGAGDTATVMGDAALGVTWFSGYKVA